MTPFAQQPDDSLLLKLGERFTLTCAVTKGDVPLTINWSVSPRPAAESTSIKTVQIDPYTGLLSIDALRPEHSGNYSCQVSNAAGTVSQSQAVLIQGTFWPSNGDGDGIFCMSLFPHLLHMRPMGRFSF